MIGANAMADEIVSDSNAGRDGRGRFVKGVSGNPAGRRVGILNEATRIAAGLLSERAPDLVRAAIDRALAGNDMPLKYCLDRIIAPQKDQPMVLPMQPGTLTAGDGAEVADAMNAVFDAVAAGTITPSQAATLTRAFADQAHAVATSEQAIERRTAAAAPAIWHRMQLRACTVIADGVREISEEAGEVDGKVRELCQPMLGIGRAALNMLAAIPDRVDLILADRAFIADHPVPPGHQPHPLAAEMGQLLAALSQYLDRNMGRLERLIEERALARSVAGRADPIYRSWFFQPGGNWFNHDATFT